MSLDWLLEYSLHPNAAVLVGGIVFAVICISWIFNRKQVYAPGVPIYGGSDDVSLKKNRMRFVHDSKSMLLEGYWQVSKKTFSSPRACMEISSLRFFYSHINAQNNRGPFYVPSKLGERLMLPNKYLEDLKSAPVHEVDFVATFIEVRR